MCLFLKTKKKNNKKLCTNFRKEKKMLSHKKGGQVEHGKSQTATGPKPPQSVECHFIQT